MILHSPKVSPHKHFLVTEEEGVTRNLVDITFNQVIYINTT